MGNKIVEGLSYITRKTQRIRPDIYMLDFRAVNAYMLKTGIETWLLVDTGLENSSEFIAGEAREIFGERSRPEAIILTHGHFDHVGSLKALTKRWDVPVYIHENELPYITGQKDYPLPDDTKGGGLITRMSDTFPHTAIDVGHYANALPKDNSIPYSGQWKWIFSPGHSEGHVSLFRESDRTLIAGDAISTVKQGSLWSVITQSETICGPPEYLTEDFDKAQESVEMLLSLDPVLLLPSHGRPVESADLKAKSQHAIVNEQESVYSAESRET
jgi:glyoxylase-like metal-dependent hydrolase (beta-lactamase superfamily II)